MAGYAGVVMDDLAHTRKILDDLAGLFLSGIASPTPVKGDPPADSQSHLVSPRRRKNRSTMARRDQLEAPEPVPMTPNACRCRVDRNAPVVQANTPLSQSSPGRLHPNPIQRKGPGHHIDRHKPETDAVRVEAVLLGNLPGVSGPWLTQYAYRLAGRQGPVAILCVDDDAVHIELVGRQQQLLDDLNASVTSLAPGQASLVDVLDRLADPETVSVKTWLVHFPTPMTPEHRRWASVVDRWTLLCGADEAAVVGAYRLLKQLRVPSSRRNDRRSPRHVGVMMMGADDGQAHTAAAKLHQAAERFLHTPVQWIGSQKQMQPIKRRSLGALTDDRKDFWPTLYRFLHQFQHASQPEGSDPPTSDFVGQKMALRRSESSEVRGQSVCGQQDHFEEVDQQPVTATLSSSSDAPGSDGSSGTPSDLGAFLACAGVTTLPVRCPRCPDVQLALDVEGRLHVMVWRGGSTAIQEAASTSSNQEGLSQALLNLMGVSHWAVEHATLLQLGQSHQSVDTRTPTVLHLFTDQAKAAVTWVSWLGTTVKFHLLQGFDTGDDRQWICTELN